MDRRSFLKSLLGAAAYEAAKKIFVFAPIGGWNNRIAPGEALFILPPEAMKGWTYRYAYRNSITGHVSDLWATPLTVAQVNSATFGLSPDLVEIYHRVPGREEFEYQLTCPMNG